MIEVIFIFIKVDKVTKYYGSRLILDGISLEVEKGEFLTLLGSSGCGKTTLLNSIAGLTNIDSGEISVNESVWSKKKYTMPTEHRNIGMVFQDFALWPHLTVFDNIAFALKLKKDKKYTKEKISQRIEEVLDVVQMNGYQRYYPHQLSGGQKQRIAVARALAPNPFFLLMDEPLSSLDAKMRERMRWELLEIVKGAQITTIYVTHDQIEALSMSDNIILLNGGKIEQEGTPVKLFKNPKTEFAANFLGASNLIQGKLLDIKEEKMLIDCNGFNIITKPIDDVKEFVDIRIHPSDILINSEYEGESTKLTGIIKQRAFQGSSWQYKIKLVATENIYLEVFSRIEKPIDSEVYLCLPASSCHVVSRIA